MMPSAKNKDPNSPAAKPYRNPNIPGISPEELAAMRSEAQRPNSPTPRPLEPKGSMIGYSRSELKELEKLVLPSPEYRESTQDIARKTEAAANKSKGELSNTPAPGTPAKESLPADNHPLLPTEGTVFPEEVRKEYKQTHNVDMKGKIIPVKPELTQLLDTPMFARGGNIYVEEGKSTDPKSKPMQFEYANVVRGTKAKHRNHRNSILRYSQNDAWAAEQRKRQAILDNERRRKALADKAAADKAAADKRKADKAAADKAAADKRKADETARQQRVAANQAAKVGGAAGSAALNKAGVNPKADGSAKQTNESQTKTKRQIKKHTPIDLTPFMPKGNDGKPKKPEDHQQTQEQLKKTVQAKSGLRNVLKDSTFNGTLVSGVLNPALGAQAFKGSNNFPGVPGKDKGTGAGSEQKKSSGFFSGALKMAQSSGIADMGQKILKGGSNLVDIAKTAPKPLLELTNPAMLAASVIPGAAGAFSSLFGAPANAATVPSQATVAPKPQEEKKKEDGGSWWDKAKSFGGALVNNAKAAGTSAINSVKEVGNSVSKTAGDAWNGASKWVSDHKAEIAITVGVVALVAATVLTGGAALAVAGAVAGGAAVSAGTVATVVAGGVVAGAGLNLAQQGAQIKDGVVDPATGKKKTDINFGDVAKSGAIGGVMAPVGAAAFGLAPVAVGALGLVGGGQGVKSGIENVQQGHNWSAGLNFLEAGAAFMPMASKNGRNAMFGAEARARTTQTAGQVWSGTKNLSGQAWSGTKNLGAQAWNGVKNFGAQGFGGVKNFSAQAWNGTKNLSTQAWNSTKNLGAQAWSGAKDLGSQAWNGAQNFKGMITGADGLSFIDPILASGSKSGMMRNIGAWRLNNFRNNSTQYYHGTTDNYAANIRAKGIDLSRGRPDLDFGQGFYTTQSRSHASARAEQMIKLYGGDPEVLTYRVPNSQFTQLKGLEFTEPNTIWKNFTLGNRSGTLPPHGHDYVSGPVLRGCLRNRKRLKKALWV
jgi:hypothetical protein